MWVNLIVLFVSVFILYVFFYYLYMIFVTSNLNANVFGQKSKLAATEK